MKTVLTCGFCRKLFNIGAMHECIIELIDLDDPVPRMKKFTLKIEVKRIDQEKVN